MAFDVGSIVGKLELGIKGWTDSIDKVKKDQQSLSGLIQRHSAEIEKLGKQFAIAGAAITGALGLMIKKTADAGDMFNDMSQRTGISVEVLSSLKLAADKSGTSIDSIASSMKFLADKMVETSQAGDPAATILGALGIKATDSSGKLRDMNDVLFDVADKFAGMEGGAVKTRLAVELFGRAGQDLIPMLNMGKKGLEENVEAAKKLGIVFTTKGAAAADGFNDALGNLKAASTGLGKVIGENLMPMVQGIAEKITGTISKVTEWADKNPELAKTLETVALALGGIMTGMGSMLFILPKVVAAFSSLAAMVGISTAALAASLAGITLLVTAAAVAYQKITELTKAKELATEADYNAFESNRLLGEKIREIGDAAGITRKEINELTNKYDGNNAALLTAISRGKEGVDLEREYKKYKEEHTKATEAATKATADATKGSDYYQKVLDVLSKTNEKVKDTTEKAKDEVIKLGIMWDFAGYRAKLLKDSGVVPLSEYMVRTMIPGVQLATKELGNLAQYSWNTRTALLNMYPPSDPLKKIADKSKDTTGTMASGWSDFFSGVTQQWSDVIKGFITGGASIVTTWNRMWKTLWETAYDVLAKKIAGAIIKCLEGLASGAKKGTESAAGSFAGLSISAIASIGFIGLALYGLYDFFTAKNNFKYWHDQWDESIKKTRDKYADMGLTLDEINEKIKDIIDNNNRWLESTTPGRGGTDDRGEERGRGPGRNRPRTETAGAGSGATVNIALHSPLVSTTGLSNRDLESAGEQMWSIIKLQASREGVAFA